MLFSLGPWVDHATRPPQPLITGRAFVSHSHSGVTTAWWKQRICSGAGRLLRPTSSLAGVQTADPVLALTFDDGPDPASTPAVLDALDRHGVHATFFMLADRAAAHPDVARSVVAAGHQVGLHGDDHTRLSSRPPAEVRARLNAAQARLEDVLGAPVRHLRFPFGDQRLSDVLAARRLGLDSVVWSVWAEDWRAQPLDQMVERTAGAAFNGAIVLLHDAYEEPLAPDPVPDRGQWVDRLLTRLRADGYAPLRLDALVRRGRPIHVPWFSIRATRADEPGPRPSRVPEAGAGPVLGGAALPLLDAEERA